MRFKLLLPIGLLLGLLASCSTPTTTPCSNSSQCGHSKTCQSGSCQAQTSSNCKTNSPCGSSQACINSVCRTNSCQQNSDCTDVSLSCQSNTCKPQTSSDCKSSSICVANGATNNTACVNSKCGCSSNADCSGSTPVCGSDGQCAASATCTPTSGCNANNGQVCTAGTCAAQACTVDSSCPGTSVCNGTTCVAQTSAHCRNASVCNLGQSCTGTTPACTNTTCTKKSDCSAFAGADCIAGNCAQNVCSGTGAGNCTDPNETCQSNTCQAQTSSNCRAGFANCPVSGDTCATGTCTCVSGMGAGCTAGDICVAGTCQAQTATSCIPGGTFCSVSVLANESCSTAGQCVCGQQAGAVACSNGQSCSLNGTTGTCTNPPRYAFITATEFSGDLGGLSGADALCQKEYTSSRFQIPTSQVTFKSVLATDSSTMYQKAISFASTALPVWDLTNKVLFTGPLSPTPGSTCSNTPVGFECVKQWVPQTGSNLLGLSVLGTPATSASIISFWAGANDFISNAPSGVACSTWTNANNSGQGTSINFSVNPGVNYMVYGSDLGSCNPNPPGAPGLLCLESD